MEKELVNVEMVAAKILVIRGKRVMLSNHLAQLYDVPVKVFTQAVKRNLERFPEDFMFQLTWEEVESSRSQFVTLNEPLGNKGDRMISRGRNIKYLPYAFTEQGVAMLSSVLNSKRAIQVNIRIMRAFVKLREILLTHQDLAAKIEALELKYKNHDIKFTEYDAHIAAIFEAIKALMDPTPEPPKPKIGFHGVGRNGDSNPTVT